VTLAKTRGKLSLKELRMRKDLVGGQIFQQALEIPMGTNCASFLADLIFVFL
jgi:hypothetical protein